MKKYHFVLKNIFNENICFEKKPVEKGEMMSRLIYNFYPLLTLLIFCFCLTASGTSYIEERDNIWFLGNEIIELQFNSKNGCLISLTNKFSGKTLQIQSDDFSIGIDGRNPLTLKDFSFKRNDSKSVDGSKLVILSYENASEGLSLNIFYQLFDKDFFFRRWFELTSKTALPLRQVDAWLVKIDGKCTHQGFGEPVFLDDTFWGLEYPAGRNKYADGVVKLTQYPGKSLEKFISKTAVAGVSEKGNVEKRFKQYVDTFRITPKETTLFVNYNTWWTLMPPTEKNSLDLINIFKTKLSDAHGESIDTFTVDDGWDDDTTLWEFDKGFPNGFENLKKALNRMNTKLGLWISPSSGYNHGPYLNKQGYDINSNGWHLCQSGEKYRKDMPKRVTDLMKTYDIAFIKFDGFAAGCDAKDHSHLPGEYSVDANVDAYIEMLEEVRKVNPKIYLDLTCGIWLSPWWLKYADSLWGEIAGDYPDPVLPSPILKDSMTTTRDEVFRQRCREHPGLPVDSIEHLGIIVITPEKWEDDAMIVLGRGCRLLTLYITPNLFPNGDKDWAFLASALKWSRHHSETLVNTQLILGDPFKREVYGYSHFGNAANGGIISLRNPFIEAKNVELKLDESIGWARELIDGKQTSYIARIVYPREETLPDVYKQGDTLQIKLQAFESMQIQFEPLIGNKPFLAGIRHQKISQNGKEIKYEVYGMTGEKIAPALIGNNMMVKASLDNKTITFTKTDKGGMNIPLHFPGKEQKASANTNGFKPNLGEESWDISGEITANIPKESKAEIHILAEGKQRYSDGFECTALVNGKQVKVRETKSPAKGQWVWFIFDVPSGENKISIKITPASGGGIFQGEIGCWLWLEHKLQKAELTVQFQNALPKMADEPLPIPLNMETRREVITIQAPKSYSTGKDWHEPQKLEKITTPTVYLDTVLPDKVTQGYGTLQRRQSVMERELIIAGKKFARGLGTHSNGSIIFNLPEGRFKKFKALVGRDDNIADGKISFEVWLDDKKVFDSGIMAKATPAKEVEIDVSGAKTLELRTLDGCDGITSDHGDWVNARLEQ